MAHLIRKQAEVVVKDGEVKITIVLDLNLHIDSSEISNGEKPTSLRVVPDFDSSGRLKSFGKSERPL